MRVLPIIFKTDMVRAILDERKTVTRRVIKPQPEPEMVHSLGCCISSTNIKDIGKWGFGNKEYGCRCMYVKPPYELGDILYVRETFTVYQTVNYIRYPDGRAFSEISDGKYAYKADGHEDIEDLKDDIRLSSDESFEGCEVWENKWHPSIHMPKAAARIWLKVTDVRVERLHDAVNPLKYPHGKYNTIVREGFKYTCDFITGWNKPIKKSDLALYGWDANPWVWVIEFERCEKPNGI